MAGDTYWSSVSLLMHFEGADEGTSFTDSGPLAHTLTGVVNAKTDTAQAKFGSTSGRFPWGSAAYVSVPNGSSLDFGSGDFTIEFFAYLYATPTQNVYILHRYDDSHKGAFSFYLTTANALQFSSASGTASWDIANFRAIGTITAAWHHIAVTRSGTTFRSYFDGTKVDEWTSSAALSTSYTDAMRVGGQGSSGGSVWMDELRLTKGVARYTGTSFTVPTEAYPDGPPSGDPGSIAFTGYAPTVYPLTASVGSGAVSFTGIAPSTFPPKVLAPGVGSISIAGQAVSLHSYESGVGSVTFAGAAPQVLRNRNYNTLVGSLTIQGVIPTLYFGGMTCDAELKAITGTSDILQGAVGIAAPSLEKITASAQTVDSTAVILEKIAATAVALAGAVGTGAPNLRQIISTAEAGAVGYAYAAPTLRNIISSAEAFQVALITAGPRLSKIYATASAVSGTVGTVDAALKRFTSTAEAYVAGIASGVGLLPKMEVAAFVDTRIDEAYRTWAMNMTNEAMTEFLNFSFNSYAVFNGGVYAAGPSGLYTLGGTKDDTTNIDWVIRTGFMDDKNTQLKRMEELLLATRYTGPVKLKVWVNDDDYHEYILPHMKDALQQVRAKIGKGLRSRYFRIELTGTDNSTIQLDSLQTTLVPVERRIG